MVQSIHSKNNIIMEQISIQSIHSNDKKKFFCVTFLMNEQINNNDIDDNNYNINFIQHFFIFYINSYLAF